MSGTRYNLYANPPGCPGVVKAHEPVGVQALGPELAIEGFDEAVVRRLARPGKVQKDDALQIGHRSRSREMNSLLLSTLIDWG